MQVAKKWGAILVIVVVFGTLGSVVALGVIWMASMLEWLGDAVLALVEGGMR